MIQRKQSLLILIALLLLGTLVALPIDTIASINGILELHWNKLLDVTPQTTESVVRQLSPLALIVVLTVVLNVSGLFLFRRRPLQMRVVGIAAGIEIGLTALLVYLSVTIASSIEADVHFNVMWLTPLAAAVVDILAYRAISDDEALVNSLNRLR